MNDNAVFSDGDQILFLVFVCLAIAWPLACAFFVGRRRGYIGGVICLATVAAFFVVAFFFLGIGDGPSPWPALLTWAVIPPLAAYSVLQLNQDKK